MDLREVLMTKLMEADKGSDGGDVELKGDNLNGDDSEGIDEDVNGEGGDKDVANTGGTPGKKGDGDDEPKTFTQEELDRIIADRLARERKKQKEKAEQERLKEEGKYKELYEKTQQALIATKKAALLKDAGYTEEQVELFTNLLQGETDEELTASLEKLKAANPPFKRNYVDPSEGNGRKQTPPKKDAEEAGKTLFQRLKEKGKVR